MQQSFDTNKSVDCKDKFLVLSIPVPDQGIAHLNEQNEKDRLKTLAALFSNPHVKKKQSKLKFDDNRFESAYWSQQLDADAVRREGGDSTSKAVEEAADKSSTSGGSGGGGATSGSGVSGARGESVSGSAGEAAAADGGSEADAFAPAAENADVGGSAVASGDSGENVSAAATFDTSKGAETAGILAVDADGRSTATAGAEDASSENGAGTDGNAASAGATGASASSGSDQGRSGTKASVSRSPEIQPGGGEAKVGSEGGAGLGGGGDGLGGIMKNVTRAEHERVIKDMILIRNKYTSLLKTAIKHTAERDKFEELLHKARAETNKVGALCVLYTFLRARWTMSPSVIVLVVSEEFLR